MLNITIHQEQSRIIQFVNFTPITLLIKHIITDNKLARRLLSRGMHIQRVVTTAYLSPSNAIATPESPVLDIMVAAQKVLEA